MRNKLKKSKEMLKMEKQVEEKIMKAISEENFSEVSDLVRWNDVSYEEVVKLFENDELFQRFAKCEIYTIMKYENMGNVEKLFALDVKVTNKFLVDAICSRMKLKNRVIMVRALIEKGVELDTQSDMGLNAIMYASDDTEIVQMLVDAGANLDLKDCSGYTVLDRAKEQEYTKTIRILEKAIQNRKKGDVDCA